MKLLFICTGNMFRSPTAMLVAQKLLEGKGCEFDSAGTSEEQNKLMAKKMRKAMEEKGYKFEPTRSKTVTQTHIDWCDHVIYMTKTHEQKLLAKFGDSIRPKMVLLSDHSIDKRLTSIKDPAFDSRPEAGPECLENIEECLENFFKHIKLLTL